MPSENLSQQETKEKVKNLEHALESSTENDALLSVKNALDTINAKSNEAELALQHAKNELPENNDLNTNLNSIKNELDVIVQSGQGDIKIIYKDIIGSKVETASREKNYSENPQDFRKDKKELSEKIHLDIKDKLAKLENLESKKELINTLSALCILEPNNWVNLCKSLNIPKEQVLESFKKTGLEMPTESTQTLVFSEDRKNLKEIFSTKNSQELFDLNSFYLEKKSENLEMLPLTHNSRAFEYKGQELKNPFECESYPIREQKDCMKNIFKMHESQYINLTLGELGAFKKDQIKSIAESFNNDIDNSDRFKSVQEYERGFNQDVQVKLVDGILEIENKSEMDFLESLEIDQIHQNAFNQEFKPLAQEINEILENDAAYQNLDKPYSSADYHVINSEARELLEKTWDKSIGVLDLVGREYLSAKVEENDVTLVLLKNYYAANPGEIHPTFIKLLSGSSKNNLEALNKIFTEQKELLKDKKQYSEVSTEVAEHQSEKEAAFQDVKNKIVSSREFMLMDRLFGERKEELDEEGLADFFTAQLTDSEKTKIEIHREQKEHLYMQDIQGTAITDSLEDAGKEYFKNITLEQFIHDPEPVARLLYNKVNIDGMRQILGVEKKYSNTTTENNHRVMDANFDIEGGNMRSLENISIGQIFKLESSSNFLLEQMKVSDLNDPQRSVKFSLASKKMGDIFRTNIIKGETKPIFNSAKVDLPSLANADFGEISFSKDTNYEIQKYPGQGAQSILFFNDTERVDVNISYELKEYETLIESAIVENQKLYNDFVEKINKELGIDMTTPLKPLDVDESIFIESIAKLPALDRIVEIKKWINENGLYNYDHTGLEEGSMEKQIAKMTSEGADVLDAKPHLKYIGVCAEYSTLGLNLLRHAGIPAGQSTGWSAENGVSDSKRKHAVNFTLMPTIGGGFTVEQIDLTCQEIWQDKRNGIADTENAIPDFGFKNPEDILAENSTEQKNEIESILENIIIEKAAEEGESEESVEGESMLEKQINALGNGDRERIINLVNGSLREKNQQADIMKIKNILANFKYLQVPERNASWSDQEYGERIIEFNAREILNAPEKYSAESDQIEQIHSPELLKSMISSRLVIDENGNMLKQEDFSNIEKNMTNHVYKSFLEIMNKNQSISGNIAKLLLIEDLLNKK